MSWQFGVAPWLGDPAPSPPVARIIIDNDFAGDPDGLYQLVHHLLSPSVEIRGIIGSHLAVGDPFHPGPGSAAAGLARVRQLCDLLGLDPGDRLWVGAEAGLVDALTPQDSPAVRSIITEAMRDDTALPLYLVCGGGLTEIVSAWLLEPRIADRLTVIWIGGPEYPGQRESPPGAAEVEYNLAIDLIGGQVLFGASALELWQVPRNVYRQFLVSEAQLRARVAPHGPVGALLHTSIVQVRQHLHAAGQPVPETYLLGDSALVLLTVLQSIFEPEASSSEYVVVSAPKINRRGLLEPDPEGRPIRVYTRLDSQLAFEDLTLKLELFAHWQQQIGPTAAPTTAPAAAPTTAPAAALWSNPLVPGFHPDPSICQVGDRYYLACSSFEFLPGLPLYESTDLVTWTPVGHVVDRADQLGVRNVPTFGGAWAPTLRHHQGRFHLVVTDALGRGNLLFTADRIEGPWSDGTALVGIDGIDPDLAWDQDGTCYLTYSGLRLSPEAGPEHLGIQQVRLDLTTGAALEEPRSLWSGSGGIFPEAPHLYQIEDSWYLLVAEGGTERGHAVSIARAPTPTGPFEGCPSNPLLTARGTDRPVQSTGHADLFRTPAGDWAMVLLGVRPRGAVRSFSALGRETFATGVRWQEGWPVVEPVRLDPPAPPVVLTDDFGGPTLGPAWIGIRRLPTDFGRLEAGRLLLTGDGSTMDDPRPSFVGRRQQHESIRVSAQIDVSAAGAAGVDSATRATRATSATSAAGAGGAVGVGGLSVRIDADNHCEIELDQGVVRARAVVAGVRQIWEAPAPPGPVVLWLATVPPPTGFGLQPAVTCDLVELGYHGPDGEQQLAVIDGRTLSTEGAGSFTGRVVGVYAVEGELAVDWFHYEGEDNPR